MIIYKQGYPKPIFSKTAKDVPVPSFRNHTYVADYDTVQNLYRDHQPVEMSDNQLSSIIVWYSSSPYNYTLVQGCNVPLLVGTCTILYLYFLVRSSHLVA
jgi:hypothetical protein